MNYKIIFLLTLVLFQISHAFPKRTAEQITKQAELTSKLNQTPNDVDLRFELAMAYASTGWIELGWEQLKLVPKLNSNYEKVVYDKYSELVKREPDNWGAHFRLAFAHYFKKDKAAAIKSFKQVLAIKPDHIWSMGLIALILGEQKQYDECIKWSKKALEINNDATAIHFLLGSAYYETGDYFGVLGQTIQVGRLKSIESKYRPTPPKGLDDIQ